MTKAIARWTGRALLVGLGALLGTLATSFVEGRAAAPETRDRIVTGIGGVFFKAENPPALRTWYAEHLGIESGEQGFDFVWRQAEEPERTGRTVWTIFPQETDYFGREDQECMINYRVDDLGRVLRHLAEKGVRPVGEVEEYSYGRFAWIVDGEGNRVELWEPLSESSAE